MKKQLERADALDEAAKYSFLPTSFVLPAEYGTVLLAGVRSMMQSVSSELSCVGLFVEAFKREGGGVWIMKPIGKAQGKGIFLFTKLSDIKDWKKDHTWKSDAPQVSLGGVNFERFSSTATCSHVACDVQAESYVVQKYIENPYTIGGSLCLFRNCVLRQGQLVLVFQAKSLTCAFTPW